MFDLITMVTALEYFDFISFALFCRSIPFASAHIGVLQLIVGYSGRFIGSILIIYFAKKYGNQKILILSIWSITISTLLISILPNTPLSLIFLFILRGVQGLAFSVEFPTSAIIGKNKTSSVISGATLGYIFASFLFQIIKKFLSIELMSSIGWRIPCFIGGLTGLYIAFQRTQNFMESLHQDQPLFKYFSVILLGLVILSNASTIYSLMKDLLGLILHVITFFDLDALKVILMSIIVFPLFAICSYLIEFAKGALEIIKTVIQSPLNLLSLICSYLYQIVYLSEKATLLLLILGPILLSRNWKSKIVLILDRWYFKSILYFVYLFYGLNQSMLQTHFVSQNPNLSSVNTISLIVSILISWLYKINPNISYFINLLITGSLFIRTSPPNSMCETFGNLSAPGSIVLNQIIVTTYMLFGLQYSITLFSHRKYLAPVVYNGIALLASLSLNQLWPSWLELLWSWICRPIMAFSFFR